MVEPRGVDERQHPEDAGETRAAFVLGDHAPDRDARRDGAPGERRRDQLVPLCEHRPRIERSEAHRVAAAAVDQPEGGRADTARRHREVRIDQQQHTRRACGGRQHASDEPVRVHDRHAAHDAVTLADVDGHRPFEVRGRDGDDPGRRRRQPEVVTEAQQRTHVSELALEVRIRTSALAQLRDLVPQALVLGPGGEEVRDVDAEAAQRRHDP